MSCVSKKGSTFAFSNGDLVIKRSMNPFPGIGPVFTVKGIEKFANGKYRFSGRYVFDEKDLIKITEEESERLRAIWEDSARIRETLRREISVSCYREDNGEPKMKFTDTRFQSILYTYRMRNPEGEYEAYRCEHCGFVHIGKAKGLRE